jgi:HSP20 family molecular chaperone IbpA
MEEWLMLLPSVFNDNVFDDLMDDFDDVFSVRNPLYGKHARNMMKTDVRDVGDHYELDIDLPGFKKDEIHAALQDGYLTISASKGLDKDEKDKKGQYIRRERAVGQCARTFFVGDGVTEADVKAKYENGILQLSIPKKEAKKVDTKKYIAIEG